MAETILQFPDRYVGAIGWSTCGSDVSDHWVRAEGRVTIPAGVALSVSPRDAACLEPLLPVALQVDSLFVNKTPITGEELWPVAAFTSLTYFHASKARKLDDAGVRHLAGLFRLEHLDLYSTLVTDEALVSLAHMEKLRQLHLGATQVQGYGLPALRGLRNLTWLSLEDTKVGDKALAKLDGSALAKLALWGSRVTPDGVRAFQHRYPRCNVVVNMKHLEELAQRRADARLRLTLLIQRVPGSYALPAEADEEAVAAEANRLFPPGTRFEALPVDEKPWAVVVEKNWSPDELWAPMPAVMLKVLGTGSKIRVAFPDGRHVTVRWLSARGADRRRPEPRLLAN